MSSVSEEDLLLEESHLELELPFEPQGAEDEGDLDDLEPRRITEAVVTGTDWTTETILSQLRRGTIQLNPRFQRRDAWTPPRKSRFIESLFLGLPIPQIVLAERKDRRGHYLVIDGKQRLLTLLQFAASPDTEDGEPGESYEPLRLRGLEVLTGLNRKSFAELKQDPTYSDQIAGFENQTIRTVVVKNWPDEDFLYLIFLRLNTGSVQLSPQELRQALNPGPFVDFIDDFATDSGPVRMALNLNRPDFRMRDVELVVRFFGFHLFLDSYTGNLKHFLDMTCRELNEEWESKHELILETADLLDEAIRFTFEIFGTNAFRRWRGDRFESFFNRAVFDVMAFYFKHAQLRDAAADKADAVIAGFKELTETSEAFDLALRSTTKSIEATYIRLSEWGEKLSRVLEGDVPIPRLEDGRIHPQ